MEVEETPDNETSPKPEEKPKENPAMSDDTKGMIAAGLGYTVIPAGTLMASDMAGAWITEQLEGVNEDGTNKLFTETPALKAIIPIMKIGFGFLGIYGTHKKITGPWKHMGYGACGGVVISGITDGVEIIMDAFEDMAA